MTMILYYIKCSHSFLDGRGLYIEGKPKVETAIRNAINAGVFIAFVILDNPHAKDSILDIKVPVFHGPGKVGTKTNSAGGFYHSSLLNKRWDDCNFSLF